MAPADKNGDITAFNPSSNDIEKDKVRDIGNGGGGVGGSNGLFGLRLGSKDDEEEEVEEEELRVPVSPTIAVVFLGEFLQVLTGGKFSATPHRVRCLPATSPSNSSVSSPVGKGSSVRGLHSPFTLMSSTHNSPDTDNNINNSNSNNNSNNNINNNNNNDDIAHGCSYYNILDTATSKCSEKSPPHVLNIPAPPQKAQNFLPDILQTPPSKNVLPVKNIFPTKNIPPTPTSITSLSSINSSEHHISPHPKLKNIPQRSPLSVIQSVLKKVPFGLKFSKARVEDKKKMTSSKKGSIVLSNDKGLSRYESNNDTEDNSILLSTRKESIRSEYDVAARTYCDAPIPLPVSVTENGTGYVTEKRIRAMSDVSVNSNPSLMTKHNREPLKNNPVFRSRRKPTYKIDSDVTAFSVDMNDLAPLPQYCDARKYKMVPTSYRVSCPFIIRGKHTAVINIRNKNYQHKNWGALGLNFKANTSEKEDKENINRNTAENKNTSPTSTSTSNNNNNNSPDSERESIYTPGQTKKWIMPDLDGTSMLLIHKLLDMKRKRCANMHESSDSDWVLSAFPVQPPAIPESDDCDESRLL